MLNTINNTANTSISAEEKIAQIRADFPILQETVNGQPLVYLDNGATTQKPKRVIEALDNYYSTINSNVHRGVHTLSQKATGGHEASRVAVQKFINAPSDRLINFTKGTTESINLVAQCYGQTFLKEGDEVLISAMEHHSNIVPWQYACERTGAKLKVIPVNEKGELIFEEFEKQLNEKTKIVSLVYVSNSLGTINPVKQVIEKAHEVGAVVLVDAAQAVMHSRVDVQELDCDFLVFSGHKMCGPTGMGVLYGKEALLEKMPPYQFGGEMIKEVRFEKTTYNELPFKFEAGTPNIAGSIALHAAIDYINEVGWDFIETHEKLLLEYATEQMQSIEGLRIVGTAEKKASVISFLLGEHHPYDVGVLLDQMGIAVRTGHHCCQPLMNLFEIEGTCRASFAFYNTKEEVDRLVAALQRVQGMLG